MRLFFLIGIITILLSSCGNNDSAPHYNTISVEGYERKPMNRKPQKQFPFDIDVRVTEDKIANTKEIFKNRKKPVVLSFWLTTCAPCFAKFNAFSKRYDDMKSEIDFDYYAISIDYPDNEAAVFSSAVENNWPFPILHDLNREFRRALPGGLNGMPQTFVYDTDGNLVLHQKKGESLDFNQLAEVLKSASK